MTFELRRLGSELLTNGDFANWTSNNPDSWTVNESVPNSEIKESAAGGECRFISDGTICRIDQSVVSSSKTYRVQFRVARNSSTDTTVGNLKVNAGGTEKSFTSTAAGLLVRGTVTAGSSHTDLRVVRDQGEPIDIDIDDISCKEVLGGSELILPNPSFGNAQTRRRPQSSGESVAGTFYVYDRGVARMEYVFDWRSPHKGLKYSEADALLAWFNDIAKGMLNTFTVEYDDPRRTIDGGGTDPFVIPTARFSSTELDIREDTSNTGLYSARIVLRDN